MQQEGKARFLKFHQGSVRGVAFSPRDRYLFCSGGHDGKVNLFSALRMELLMCYHIATMSWFRNVNAVKFTSDGTRILASTTARRLAVIDVERGEQFMAYDNCAFNGRDRTGLAVDPICPNIAVCACVNGKGLTLFDLRMPLPFDFIYDLHSNVIRDLVFLHPSWPWVRSQQGTIMSVAYDGSVKITPLDGSILHCFHTGHNTNSICPTPEPYGSGSENGFYSLVMCGGDMVSAYAPDSGVQEHFRDHRDCPIWKLRYTSNGSLLYSACDGGVVRRYRRYPDHHYYLGEVYHHKADIQDMDISAYDDYIVTASKDRTIGILSLGSPNHGWTEYSELT